MLVWLLDWLTLAWPDGCAAGWGAVEKTTFRAALAAAVSFALALILGRRMIRWLQAHFREPIKSDSARLNQLHQAKQWTPTMGGLFLVAGLAASVLAFGDLSNRYLQITLLVTAGLTLVGALDDLCKLRSRAKGISARAKLLGQLAVASLGAGLLYSHQANVPGGLDFSLPSVGTVGSLGVLFIPWTILLIVGFSNAVNLTDGLDGLAGGCVIFAVAAVAVMAYVGGHAELAEYLNAPKMPGAGEMVVVAGGVIGGLMGFLWFNCHPAQVFMGDTGSLPLGGVLAMLAIIARQEVLLLVVGGVFVAEAASVVLQVGFFKWRRRRLFLCAPLHHHFQFQGWPEGKIVVRFWIASALCAMVGIAGLKLTLNDHGAQSHRSSAAPRVTAGAISPSRPNSDRFTSSGHP
jgi:phospho-N-acetylmuramoyl-pentapeptide-transferase